MKNPSKVVKNATLERLHFNLGKMQNNSINAMAFFTNEFIRFAICAAQRRYGDYYASTLQ